MDAVDRRIIRELQRDGALSTAALAELVGASQASCWRRVRALEEAGILGQTVRLLSTAMLSSFVTVICHVRMRDHSPESSALFRSYVIDLPEVMECYSMSGEWDYLLRILMKDVASYEDFLMHRLLNHAAVATASSHFALSTVKYTTAIPL